MFNHLLFQMYWSQWSKSGIADGKLFQEQCLKIWQENSEPLRQSIMHFAQWSLLFCCTLYIHKN